MKLYELVGSMDYTWTQQFSRSVSVKDVKVNSKRVRNGDLFIAIVGPKYNGHVFLQEAVEQGASAVIVQDESALATIRSYEVAKIVVADTRCAFASISAAFFSHPSRTLNVVGVTGTNGKTTTTFLLQHIFHQYARCGIIGTLFHDTGEQRLTALNTTPSAYDCNKLFAEMLKNNIRYCFMEVSSHALEQRRVQGINFHSAIFTNLTQDHLDFHGTMEQYFKCKARLFTDASPQEVSIINVDDQYGKRLRESIESPCITYGIHAKADFRAHSIKRSFDGMRFHIKYGGNTYSLESGLIAEHDIYNILAAFVFAYKQGIPVGDIIRAIATFPGVPGRMESIASNMKPRVFIDYAHTPDAFESVLSSTKALTKGKLIVVFGCGGDRDKTKRPIMGSLAVRHSDYAVVTSDNPRFENEKSILSDIEKGIHQVSNADYCIIVDREKAIEHALSCAEARDVVLILGKGHEEYMIYKSKKVAFSDRQVVNTAMTRMKTHVNNP